MMPCVKNSLVFLRLGFFPLTTSKKEYMRCAREPVLEGGRSEGPSPPIPIELLRGP